MLHVLLCITRHNWGFFLWNSWWHYFYDVHIAKVLQMNTCCSAEYIFHSQWPMSVRHRTQLGSLYVCRKGDGGTSLTLCYWANLVQLLEFFMIMCNFLQLMEQFTLLLVPPWRLSVLPWVDVMWEMRKLQEGISCLQNVSFNTFINVKSVG
jgi:hypothetical protein